MTRLHRTPRSSRCRLRHWQCTSRCIAQPFAPALLGRQWIPALDSVLTQQVREPAREIELRDSIPRLTAIEDEVSRASPAAVRGEPLPALGAPRRASYACRRSTSTCATNVPPAPIAPLGKTDALDILVAGCGTGQIAIASAQKYLGAHVLAVDLSLSSLCYAKRNTPAPLAAQIEYAQADILKLATIGRSFDVIDCSGVLHHMADPLEGWRILLTLLRPGGLMHLGFYSEAGRKDVVAARSFIAERRLWLNAARDPPLPSGTARDAPGKRDALRRFFQHKRMPRPSVSCA